MLALIPSLLATSIVACQSPAPTKTITIELRNGTLHLLEGKPVDAQELDAAFAALNKPPGSIRLTIRANNKTITYASIVKVVDAAERSGIKFISLVEAPAE